jgi:C-3',4' desaturase CrtD
MRRAVVIGAGIGGLSTAAILARSGYSVTVLEAHIYPGGCAGTFFHKGYRFDVGATIAGGFYPGGPMDLVAEKIGLMKWPVRQADLAMVVHMPDGERIYRWCDERRLPEFQRVFGSAGETFLRWQERTADALWDLALRNPPWPPQTPTQAIRLSKKGLAWLVEDFPRRISTQYLHDAFYPVRSRLRDGSDRLRLFLDGQLLISAQTTSSTANSLYAAAALDLPRRGVVHIEGGIGKIAEILAESVRENGGRVIYRQEVERIESRDSRGYLVETKRGSKYEADLLVANLTPWNISRLMGDSAKEKLKRLPEQPEQGWGAFMVYAGVDSSAIPAGFSLHHQVIQGEPLGEGNSIFVSISPEWDASRAPAGKRAITISTHTQLKPWWRLYEQDRTGYESRKRAYLEDILKTVSSIIPHIRKAADLLLPGTPVTFQRFTRRERGWVGGFPQVSLFQAWGPRLKKGLWMVGDSIFPGQSIAAAALGGLRVAEDISLEDHRN